MYRIVITGPARRDIQECFEWWSKNRSRDQAYKWYIGLHQAIHTLRVMPERCSLAWENDLLDQGIRQLLYGFGRKRTHRVVFGIDADAVVIFRVRHTSQDTLSVDELD